jgi:hypothetical protein
VGQTRIEAGGRRKGKGKERKEEEEEEEEAEAAVARQGKAVGGRCSGPWVEPVPSTEVIIRAVPRPQHAAPAENDVWARGGESAGGGEGN